MCQGPAEQPEAEGEPAHHVTPEEATRFVQKTVHPLEPEALQHGRRTRLVSCQEAERDSDAGEPHLWELGPECLDQPLLLRKAKADQDQRRARGPQYVLDPVQRPRIVLESEGRAVGAYVRKLRIQSLEPPSGVRGHTGVSPEKE